jgi:protein-tyrosine phosphatase
LIDTHCHLLPGLDDGPATELESAELARELSVEGVTFVLCTPHFSRIYPTSTERAREGLERLKNHLAALELGLDVALAAEVSPALLASTPRDDLVARAIDDRYLLVELDRGTPAAFVTEAVSSVRELGLMPVLAHPERSRSIRHEHMLLEAARDEGALVQVVAPSLAGRWGQDVGEAAWALIDAGLVDLLASDAHRPSGTTPTLGVVLRRVAEQYGDAALYELTEAAPTRLLGGRAATADRPPERNATGTGR